MAYFVETSIIIDYLRGKQAAVDWLDGLEGDLVSSYVCLAELYEGVYRVRNRVHAAQAVQQFFASLQQVHGVDATIAEEFGRLRADLKEKGKIIEDMDLFVAATCLTHDLTLLTNNKKHFARVPGLKMLP